MSSAPPSRRLGSREVDAAFHAGWIALRFLNDPRSGARISPPRRGRRNAAVDRPRRLLAGARRRSTRQHDEARRFYERAAAYPIAYYGQLAARETGPRHARPARARAWRRARRATRRRASSPALRRRARRPRPRWPSRRRKWRDEAQLAALAERIRGARRRRRQRGVRQARDRARLRARRDRVPDFRRAGFRAARQFGRLAIVYAVARQESEFSGMPRPAPARKV